MMLQAQLESFILPVVEFGELQFESWSSSGVRFEES